MFLFFIGAKVHRNIGFQAEEWGFFLNIAPVKTGSPVPGSPGLRQDNGS